jgi:hypothetical protein
MALSSREEQELMATTVRRIYDLIIRANVTANGLC